jgi:glycosyltransferase involved in cell wall biosynthesis
MQTIVGGETMNAPNVAVVIPCCKYPQFLPEAIDSVQQQTVQPAKVVCVLDQPEDDDAYREYLNKERRKWIYVSITLPDARGVSAARNTGIQLAIDLGCQWVIPLDEDDILRPNYVKEMIGLPRPDGALLRLERVWSHFGPPQGR